MITIIKIQFLLIINILISATIIFFFPVLFLFSPQIISFVIFFVLILLLHFYEKNIFNIIIMLLFNVFLSIHISIVMNYILYFCSEGKNIVIYTIYSVISIYISCLIYAIKGKKNFLHAGYILYILYIIVFISNLFVIKFNFYQINLIISLLFVLLSIIYILYSFNQVINNKEKFYIITIIMLYIYIYNIIINIFNIYISCIIEL